MPRTPGPGPPPGSPTGGRAGVRHQFPVEHDDLLAGPDRAPVEGRAQRIGRQAPPPPGPGVPRVVRAGPRPLRRCRRVRDQRVAHGDQRVTVGQAERGRQPRATGRRPGRTRAPRPRPGRSHTGCGSTYATSVHHRAARREQRDRVRRRCAATCRSRDRAPRRRRSGVASTGNRRCPGTAARRCRRSGAPRRPSTGRPPARGGERRVRQFPPAAFGRPGVAVGSLSVPHAAVAGIARPGRRSVTHARNDRRCMGAWTRRGPAGSRSRSRRSPITTQLAEQRRQVDRVGHRLAAGVVGVQVVAGVVRRVSERRRVAGRGRAPWRSRSRRRTRRWCGSSR